MTKGITIIHIALDMYKNSEKVYMSKKKTEFFDEAREGDPVEDLVPLILDAKRFDVEISPVEGDRTCKIKIGLLDILLSIDDLVEIVQALPDAILLGK